MKTIKSKWQKLTIAFLIVLMLLNVVIPTYSSAFGGGSLINPIKDLILRDRRCNSKYYSNHMFTRFARCNNER